MLLGIVRGTVVATRKDPGLVGLRFLVVEEVDSALHPNGRFVVAADAVGAGSGELVLFASGSSARLTEVTKDRPVDAVLIGIVDQVEAEGAIVFDKSPGVAAKGNASSRP